MSRAHICPEVLNQGAHQVYRHQSATRRSGDCVQDFQYKMAGPPDMVLSSVLCISDLQVLISSAKMIGSWKRNYDPSKHTYLVSTFLLSVPVLQAES